MKVIDSCGICRSSSLEEVWDLPAFPLTERFGSYAPDNCLPIDQKLLICDECGHFQLGRQVDPDILYGSRYSFRTSSSASARSGTGIFLEFLEQLTPNQRFRSFVDIGGNDLYLARKLDQKAQNRCVIDPVCRPSEGEFLDGIQVFSKFVESVNLSSEIEVPDLIVSRHTLEHISDPIRFLQQIFDQSSEECLFVFEIPCFDNLVESMRWDAIFHQHYHYYNLNSFKSLLKEVGGEYLAHSYNYQGSCGGALLIAFRRGKKRPELSSVDVKNHKEHILSSIQLYKNEMKIMSSLLEDLPGKIYGYGASLMLATFSYHLDNNLARLECVLDDAMEKDGLSYENLPIIIRCPKNGIPEKNSHFIITSLENIRPIFKNILKFTPRRILIPNLT